MFLECGWGLLAACPLLALCASLHAEVSNTTARVSLNPLTRYFHVTYTVPAGVPDEVQVTCSWSPVGKNEWHPARVTPLISETGRVLASDADRAEWCSGRLIERRAAGLERTVIFDPYPEAQIGGLLDVDFRIDIADLNGKHIASQIVHLQADNTDVVYLTDFTNVLQQDAVSASPENGKWLLTKDASGGIRLSCEGKTPVTALTYPLDLKGPYAIFVSTDSNVGSIRLRLSGDERTERVASSEYDKERLWRWTRMNWENLVIKQCHNYDGFNASSLNYVKLVPLTEKMVNNLDAPSIGKHDRFVTAYYEPYSWAFHEDIRENYQHREPVSAFAETGIDLLDINCARFGAKSSYESRKMDTLMYSTEGDPILGKIPVTDNSGRMNQYTNVFRTQLKYAKEMGLNVNANVGATACYPSTPLEGEFSKQHPDWRRGNSLLLSVPEVRHYMISVYRELLELGAPGITIDFCRYPDGVDSAEDCNKLMRDMRKLADEFGKHRGKHVPIVVRFPSKGTRKWEFMDYKTWAQEGLVDYLCPSNIQGVYQFIDTKPYLAAVKGTHCKLTPEIDAISWGPIIPGQLLWWVNHLYDEGVDGVYIYQADDAIDSREMRECLRILTSTEAIKRWWKNDAKQRPHCSKGIYIAHPEDYMVYHKWERIRIWTEGISMGELETYIDGKFIGKMKEQPYLVGTDGFESNDVVPAGNHTLLVRAKDGDGWLEQKFSIKAAE